MQEAGNCFDSLRILILYSGSSVLSKRIVSVTSDGNNEVFKVHEGTADNTLAEATFTNNMNITGWSYLEVYTNANISDQVQAYAAGLAEGALTREMIAMYWHNTYKGYCKKPLTGFCKKLQHYFDDNLQWVGEQIHQHADSDPYWHQVQLFLAQMMGLLDGFHIKQGKRDLTKYHIDVTDINLLQVGGDVEDLAQAFGGEDHHSNHQSIHGNKRIVGSGHCSALIKLLSGNQDLYVAQDTWTGYNGMLRVLKKYDFGYHILPAKGSPIIPGRVSTFSSFPGGLMSADDFYTISTGLVTMETTIGNSNASLWSYVKAQNSVLEGLRNMAANRLATSGKEWCDTFSRFNSGTYNNEWMVVDYTKFHPGKKLGSDVLWVLDQIPGMIVARDVTSVLIKQGYFPSYNSPHFPEIYNASGWTVNEKKYGDWFSYERTPRARIFRRDHAKVKDVDSMIRLMRYNDFTHDPLSRCNCTPPYSGENAISARCDLNPASGKYPFGALGHRNHGGIDMKLTSHSLVVALEFIAVAGPTYDDLPPFQWSKSGYKDVPHVGQPDLWAFKPIKHKWGHRH
ncbi:putative phospholipase B-like 2 [Lamellibrachia satsuma]|nr:putative phospholipase B-like 2 [Lamellibrachia satsuma]